MRLAMLSSSVQRVITRVTPERSARPLRVAGAVVVGVLLAATFGIVHPRVAHAQELQGSIEGIIWLDANSDGLRDASEAGAPDVEYALVRRIPGQPSELVITGTTDATGVYRFDDLAPGNYLIIILKPLGKEFSPLDQGAEPIDSDFPNQSVLLSSAVEVELAAGGFATLDAGLIDLVDAGIGGLVWWDVDGDGVRQVDEIGLEGWPAFLLRDDAGEWVEIAEVESDVDGYYEFEALPAARYTVAFGFPVPGDFFTLADIGSDSFDSDVDPVGFSQPIDFDPSAWIRVDAGLVDGIAGDANCDGVLNILDAFATAQYVVELREGVETCALATGSDQISISAVVDRAFNEALTIQTAFRVSQCVVGLFNPLCPAEVDRRDFAN